MTNVSLSIILPCFNPLPGWIQDIENTLKELKATINSFELLIVNDGSIKNWDTEEATLSFAKWPEVKLIGYERNEGKGYALRKGVAEAKGDLIIYTDIDFPYSHDSFMKVFNTLLAGDTDVVVGIRGPEYYTHLPEARTRISKLLRWVIKKFLHIPTDDTQCGLKGFNQAGKQVFMQTTINRYLFDLEFIFLSARKKLAIKTVEVELKPDIVLSSMNWKILLQEFSNFLKIFVRSIF